MNMVIRIRKTASVSQIHNMFFILRFLIFQILTPAEALSGFSNSVVIMMVGLFVVGGAIFQTGLAKMISSRILKLAGNSETRLFLLVMLVTAGIGGFVSNTGTVALMLPIVVSLAASANLNASRLLMPLAFASSMGLFTLIATPPNLVIHEQLVSSGYPGLSFFSFFPVGLICVTVGTIVLLPLTKWFLSKKGGKDGHKKAGKSLNELVKEYGLSKFAIAGGVASNSTLRGAMREACEKNGVEFYHPSPIYCTDNAAMIGAAAYYEYLNGTRHGWDLNAVPNLKLGER